jgi:hypothetical protein
MRVEVIISRFVIGWIGDVEFEHVGIDTGGAEFCERLFALGQVARADDNFHAGTFEVEGGLEAESAIAAGNECNFLRHGVFLLCCLGF